MKKGHLALFFCFILLLSTSLFSNLLWADGFIIIRPPYPHPMPSPELPYVNIKYHNVTVGIEGAVISNFAIDEDIKPLELFPFKTTSLHDLGEIPHDLGGIPK